MASHCEIDKFGKLCSYIQRGSLVLGEFVGHLQHSQFRTIPGFSFPLTGIILILSQAQVHLNDNGSLQISSN